MDQSYYVVGHRGARGLFPENTLGGFRAAMALGVRWFEIDVGVLKDGTVVVHHDPALNPDILSVNGRFFGGSLPLLRSMPLDELEDYSVGRIRPGSEYAAQFPGQQPMDGERIPTLAEVLALDAGLRWTIELKLIADRPEWTVGVEEMVERVLAVVDAAGAAGRVVLQSFDWRAPRLVRQLRPEMAVAWLTRAETIAQAPLWWGRETPASVPEAVAAEGGGIWSPGFEDLTQPLVAEAQGLGLGVIPWTVNEIEDLVRVIGWGVDGVITDYPDQAMSLLRAGGTQSRPTPR
jgi:glycerophosphoryl diester phosphodiesterase